MAQVAAAETVIDSPPPIEPGVSAPEPTGQPDKIGFFEKLTHYTPEQWQSLLIWVYRIAPITNRLATGNKAVYVMKYGGPVDEDQLKHDLGSGTYRLQLNQTGPNGKSKPIANVVVDIEDMNFPPKVPPGEWVDDPRNKRWEWCRKKEETAAPATNGSQSNPWTPESVLHFVKQLRPDAPKEDHVTITKAVLDAVKETRTQMSEAADPTKMMTLVTSIITLLKPSAPDKPAATAEDPMFKLLFQQLADAREEAKAARDTAEKERQRIHEKEMELLKQRATAADPMDMIDKVLNIKERLGGDEPDHRNWKEKLVDEGMQHVPELIGLAKSIFGSKGYGPQQAQNGHPPQQQTPPTRPPQPAPPAQVAQPSGETMPQQNAQEPSDPDIAFLVAIFMEYGPKLVKAFADDPNSGAQLAEAIASPFVAGKSGYERIARMGREKILKAIDQIPQMKADIAAVGTPEMLNDFIDDFIDPDDDEDDEDENPDTLPVTPMAGTSGVPAKKHTPKGAKA